MSYTSPDLEDHLNERLAEFGLVVTNDKGSYLSDDSWELREHGVLISTFDNAAIASAEGLDHLLRRFASTDLQALSDIQKARTTAAETAFASWPLGSQDGMSKSAWRLERDGHSMACDISLGMADPSVTFQVNFLCAPYVGDTIANCSAVGSSQMVPFSPVAEDRDAQAAIEVQRGG